MDEQAYIDYNTKRNPWKFVVSVDKRKPVPYGIRKINGMALELTSLKKAVESLQNALRVTGSGELEKFDKAQKDVLKAGVIQNFEFTYELCWKLMRRWLKENLSPSATDGVTRRELFRMAAEQRLIDDVEQWMRYHDARNQSSHTYLPEIADKVYRTAFDFFDDARNLLQAMEERND